MTIADKLVYLGATKSAIRDAIQLKGVSVPAESTFRDYAGKIAEIDGGGGAEYPVWVGSTWSEYVTSTSVTAPAFAGGTTAGDLLILTLFTRNEPSSDPDGFTEVSRSPGVGTTSTFMIVYEKVADGDEDAFSVSLSGSADRTCVNVAAFRGSATPVILEPSSSVIDTSSQTNFQIDLGAVSNPSATAPGLVVIGIATSLANTGLDLSRTVNIPFYGWVALHNTNGTSSSHGNRMMINAVQMQAGSSQNANTPLVAMSNVDGLSTIKYLIAVAP